MAPTCCWEPTSDAASNPARSHALVASQSTSEDAVVPDLSPFDASQSIYKTAAVNQEAFFPLSPVWNEQKPAHSILPTERFRWVFEANIHNMFALKMVLSPKAGLLRVGFLFPSGKAVLAAETCPASRPVAGPVTGGSVLADSL